MLIRALNIMAGPTFRAYAGEVVDVPREKAQELIDGGWAVAVSPYARSEHLPFVTPLPVDIEARKSALARLDAEEAERRRRAEHPNSRRPAGAPAFLPKITTPQIFA